MGASLKVRWLGAVTLAALAAVAVGGAVRAAAGWPMTRRGDLWFVETPHYEFETDYAPKAAQLLASHQEALFLELYRRMGKTRSAAAIQRMKVYVYQTEDRYRQVMGDGSEGTRGLYTGTAMGAWGSQDDLDETLEVLRHEGTHQFVRQFIGETCPVWLNEGLAVYFQNATFEKGKLVSGQAPMPTVNFLKKALEGDKLMPVALMLTLSDESWRAATRTRSKYASIQYAQAWSMVHFLEAGDGGKYRTPFLQYVYFLSRKASPDEAWQRSFGTNVAAFEKRWKAYIKDLKPTSGISCRTKMAMLGDWVLAAMKQPQCLKDIETFRKVALTGALGGWVVTVGGIETEIADRESMADVFRCPQDPSKGDAPSYELVPGKPGEPPVVRCTHHVGVVLETTYVKDHEGKRRTRVVSRPILPGEKK